MSDDTKLIDSIIRTALQSAHIQGAAVAAVAEDHIVFNELYGVRNHPSRRPIDRETQFQGASLSKPVFAYGVLKLCEQGVLQLDNPLVDYDVECPCADPEARMITARHVLSHTTGFPNWRDEDEGGQGELKLHAAPGKRFGYSGEGFEYLKRVVEHVTDQPWHDYAQTNLLLPLGMTCSTFAWADAGTGPVLDNDGDVVSCGETLISGAAFSLLTTAEDYARFLIATLNPLENDLYRLSATSQAHMQVPHAQVGRHDHLYWGLGWGIQQTEAGAAIWHWGGGQNDYWNYAVSFPERRKGVVILTNTKGGMRICETIAHAVLDINAPHPAFVWLLPEDQWTEAG